MRGQAGFFDVDERLKQLSAKGDNLERLSAVVDFELFRADLERAVPRADGSKGGRPPFDHVLMFKTLIQPPLQHKTRRLRKRVPVSHLARVRTWLKYGMTIRQAADMYGVSESEIERIL